MSSLPSASVDVIDWFFRVSPKVLLALLAVVSFGVVLTVIANASRCSVSALVQCLIEVARSRVVVA